MDYGLMNMLGISAMMIFGLWAYDRGYRKRNETRCKKKERKNQQIIDREDREITR